MDETPGYAIRNQTRDLLVANRVRVAGLSHERRKGLSGVAEMPEDSGLWIIPCEAIHTFGMKMRIDVVFLDREFRVRHTRAALAPNRIAVCLRAYSVLELAPGSIERSGTRVGDHFECALMLAEGGGE
ncbi:MAG TPA: DUF192 domain-containing protein [Bryobacteraceae bacterium]|jgi:hypothetical protein|nr:DUF192 domain-containing protein [Bryobacteraceae bacterium]